MVMDATQPQQPSPQSVGREFVRQYYTLLNKAPNHLHRFYTNNSSFIHGESTLVVGQKNIHNRIQQLNFHDCHAKISQVDAQATLGNGVVVQVTGELSNDGQPMRRFTQTFVLAAQSPKNYYVHNDIFRYQDMYSDEEADGESRSENDEEHDQQQQLPPQVQTVVATNATNDQSGQAVNTTNEQQPLAGQVLSGGTGGGVLPQQPTPPVYYSLPTASGRPITVLQPATGVAPVPMAATNFTNATGVPPQQQTVQTNAGGVAQQLNGVVSHDEIISTMPQAVAAAQPQLANQTPSPVVPQATGVVSVGNTPVLNAQTPVGVAGVPVASGTTTTALQQTTGSAAMQNYQQSPIIQSHILPQQQQSQPPQQQQQIPTPMQQQTPLQNTPSQPPQQQSIQHQQQQTQTPLSSVTNLTDADESLTANQANTVSASPATVSELQTRPNTAANVVASGQTVSSSPNTVLEPPTPAPVVEDFKTINEQQQQEKYEAAKQQQQQQNEPKTYANLFKSSSSSPSSFVNAAMQQQQQIQQQQQQSVGGSSMYGNNASSINSSSYSQSANSTTSMSVYSNRNSDNGPSIRQDNNNGQIAGPLPQRGNTKGFNKDFDQRRTSNSQQFGDNQQLFLGNIPHHASEEELKSLFSQFGSVVDLRILSKSSGKILPGGRNPLNYGFITYSDPEAVQNCLANCPLYFPDNSPDGQKLNVEEKKPRARTNDMPPRQNMGGSGMNNMNNNQRNMSSGGPPSRSLSNSGSGGGSMMRGNSVGNNSSMSRGGSSGGGGAGPRMGGAFNRNDNRTSNGGSGSQMRGGNNSQTQGNSYGVRR
ncbi:ras GTPase-activating protein-binding protein 2 [Musca domestica]|uniref:Ras GTPase-activating protein-binding protein 2 n=1 Tax=Musca domestica TaxID=7370 RepID=A0A1I8N0L7_MUSDO|nr:ras GTPase-activating protein-binding protein 2 [Musca domestica]XP_005190460.1 ras GTPase-activating protein-binding protein 2 [Musca domestica]XP_011295341.1 ras GTPase-activating protein-binding protein 2 [Musca domestica]XP_058987409.1 ras GTPase-activating protein-binding protein 2 [Musca domestica]